MLWRLLLTIPRRDHRKKDLQGQFKISIDNKNSKIKKSKISQTHSVFVFVTAAFCKKRPHGGYMARLNLEYKLLSDPRFKALSRKLGERLAIGEWVAVAMAAQDYWAKEKSLIPPDIWDLNEFSEDLLRCHLVEKKDNGYYLKGSEEYFNWYLKMLEFGKKGVEARKLKAENKAKEQESELLAKDNLQHTVDHAVVTPVDCTVNSPVDCTVNFDQKSENCENLENNCTVDSSVDCTVNSPVDCTVNPPTPTPTPYKKNIYSQLVQDVIDYLNLRLNKKFSRNKPGTISLISARANEGAALEDFKQVIDIKIKDWMNTDQAKYLRPETLFGARFDSYLNQVTVMTLEEEQKKNKEYFLQNGQISESTQAVDFKEMLL